MQLLHAPFTLLKIRFRAHPTTSFLDGTRIFRTKTMTKVVASALLQEYPCRFGNGDYQKDHDHSYRPLRHNALLSETVFGTAMLEAFL